MTSDTDRAAIEVLARELTDEDWAGVFDEPNPANAVWWPEGTPQSCCVDVAALFAYLDEVWAGLTRRRRERLLSAEECDSLYSSKFRGRIRNEMQAAGLVYLLDGGAPCYAPTPLGRAVLKRAKTVAE